MLPRNIKRAFSVGFILFDGEGNVLAHSTMQSFTIVYNSDNASLGRHRTITNKHVSCNLFLLLLSGYLPCFSFSISFEVLLPLSVHLSRFLLKSFSSFPSELKNSTINRLKAINGLAQLA